MRHLVVDLDTRIKILLLEDDTILDIHSVAVSYTHLTLPTILRV